MAGYIGAKVGTVTANAADIKGDISATDTTPEITLKNTTETDADGSRSGKITFKGEQSGGEESTLAQIVASHDTAVDDEAGDLIFKTNDGSDGASPTEAMRITSDQQIGIGTVDPLRSLHVSGAGDTGLMLQTTNAVDDKEIWEIQSAADASNHANLIIRTRLNAGTSGAEAMRIKNDGNVGIIQDLNIGNNDSSNPVSKLRFGATLYGAADIVPVSSGHKVGLDFKTDSTGDTTIDPVTRMTISNEGYVTLPFQPVFGANRDGKSNMTSTNTLIDWSVIVNQGSHFDTSTNRFTCPVAGTYYCSFYSLTNTAGTSSSSFVTIRKNGSAVYAAYNDTVSSINYLSYSASGLISCAANDILDFHNVQGTVYAGSYTGGAIYLIG